MAATVTSPWASKPRSWALDSEEHEEELNQQPPAGGSSVTAAPLADFPDLMTAAATKTKKKKGQTLSLGEFVTGTTNKPAASSTYQPVKGLTVEDMMALPTGPRQRTADELERTKLGGGFRSYGERGDRNNENSSSRWSSRNGGEEGRKPSREPLGPSRADEIDDWAAAKKSSIGGGFERKERGGGGGGGFFSDSHSRADETDSWVTNKSFSPSEGRRNGGFDRERRVGFESSGAADSSDNWVRKKEEEGRRFGGGGGGGSAFDSLRERRGGNESADSDNWGKRREEGSAGGGMSRPKLNLQPRKLPVGDSETVAAVKPSKGSNPFGDARPREQVLKEKGQDWKEIDEKLESMKMKDVGSVDGPKRGFGSFNGRARSNEDPSERSWRKNESVESVEVPPPSAENSENGHTEEPEESDAQSDAQM